jgi:DNA-binding MarR family transcriptional regulator
MTVLTDPSSTDARLAARILQAVARAEVLPFTDLARALRTSYAAVGAGLDPLRQRGWVSSEMSFDGVRLRAEYRLTAAGRGALACDQAVKARFI